MNWKSVRDSMVGSLPTFSIVTGLALFGIALTGTNLARPYLLWAFGIVLVVFGVVMYILFMRLGRERNPIAPAADRQPREVSMPPWWIVILDVLWFVALVATGLTYGLSSGLQKWLPLFIGPIPIATAYWAGLGCVLIRLHATAIHWTTWKSDLNLWHAIGALPGFVMGPATYLLLTTSLSVAGTQNVDKAPTFYYGAAFLVGVFEQVFMNVTHSAAMKLRQ